MRRTPWNRWSTLPTLPCLLLGLLMWATPCFADIPKVLTYQGYLTNASGSPMVGNLAVSFHLYDQATGGTPLWSESLTVAIQAGHFTVVLGATTPIPLSLLTQSQQLYLGVKVEQDPEMTPRSALTSVPFARLAENIAPGASLNVSSIQVNGKDVVNDKGEWTGATTGLKGEKGEPGEPGAIKSFVCPYGSQLQGVDAQGKAICSTSNGALVSFPNPPTYTAVSNASSAGSVYGIHAFSDTSVAAVYYDSTSHRTSIYVTNNSGQTWTAGATWTAANLGATQAYLYGMGSADTSSFVLFWRDSTQKKSGIVRVTNAGASYSNRISLGDAGYGNALVCNEASVCVLYFAYYTSPNTYSRVYTSTDAGNTWKQTYSTTGQNYSVRNLYWSGTHFGFIRRAYVSSKYTYAFFRASSATAQGWTSSLSLTDGSMSLRYAQGDHVQLNTSLLYYSSNAGSSWNTGYPSLFGFPSVASSDCILRQASKEMFCGSSCGQRIDPGLTLPYTCLTLPTGVSGSTRTAVAPSGKFVFYHDGSNFYRFAR